MGCKITGNAMFRQTVYLSHNGLLPLPTKLGSTHPTGMLSCEHVMLCEDYLGADPGFFVEGAHPPKRYI